MEFQLPNQSLHKVYLDIISSRKQKKLMNIRIKKTLASGALAISLGALTLGVAGVSPSLAAPGTDDDVSRNPQVLGSSETTLDTSITSVTWCGWYLTGVSGALTLAPSDGVTELYDGTEIPLTVSNDGLSVYVGGDATYSDSPENCSWYGDSNKQAVEVTVTASTDAFTASSSVGSDTAMDFYLDSENPLNIGITEDTECAGFTTTSADQIQGADLVSNPVTSAVFTLVGTNDICDWSATYTTSIPAGMVPTYGGSLYSYTGPTLTTTLEIITD
jgi:hypothetical protein